MSTKMTLSHTLLTLAAGASMLASAEIRDEIDQSYPFSETGTISLSNVNGDLKITACDCSTVEINAVIIASDQETRDRVKVEIDAETDRIHIDTQYSKSNRWGKNKSVRVDYTLSVPNRVSLDELKLVNGSIYIKGVSGRLEAELVNGDIESDSMSSDSRVESVNGEVDLTYTTLTDVSDIDIETVNGRVSLTLPSNANADLDADTVNGRLSNEFGVNVKKGKYVGASMKGSIGNGGTRVELETVNGSIRVKSN